MFLLQSVNAEAEQSGTLPTLNTCSLVELKIALFGDGVVADRPPAIAAVSTQNDARLGRDNRVVGDDFVTQVVRVGDATYWQP